MHSKPPLWRRLLRVLVRKSLMPVVAFFPLEVFFCVCVWGGHVQLLGDTTKTYPPSDPPGGIGKHRDILEIYIYKNTLLNMLQL